MKASRYRNYLLFMVTLAYVFSAVDRFLLVIVQEAVKVDLGLSDTQLGVLTGFAFSAFYAVFGVIVARLADRGVRRTIVAWCVGAWSLMTAATGMALNFWHVFLARCGIGVGEGGAGPASISMLSDVFPERQRATAMGIYMTGVQMGMLIGLSLGGLLNELIGWRMTFIVIGVAGMILAPILRLTIAEPPRGAAEGESAQESEPTPPLSEVLWALARSPVFRHVAFGPAFAAMTTTAIATWLPPYLIRAYGMGTTEIGTGLAIASGLGGAIATFAGGFIGDYLGRNNPRLRLLPSTIGFVISAPLIFVVLMVGDGRAALLYYLVPGFFMALWLGPIHAINQGLVPNRMRATAAGVIMLIMNVIGTGLGPLLVGMLSDFLTPRHGVDGLRIAIMLVAGAGVFLAILHFLLAMRALPGRTVDKPPGASSALRGVE